MSAAKSATTDPVGGAELSVMAEQAPSPRPCPMAASLQLWASAGPCWRSASWITACTGSTRSRLHGGLPGHPGRPAAQARGGRSRRAPTVFGASAALRVPPDPAGKELRPVLSALAQWGSRWAQQPPTSTFAHECGHALESTRSADHCGEPVTPDTLRVRSPSAHLTFPFRPPDVMVEPRGPAHVPSRRRHRCRPSALD